MSGDERVEAHLIELYQELEHTINLLKDYQLGRVRYLRQDDVQTVIVLLRNFRREKFGNPVTDRERAEA